MPGTHDDISASTFATLTAQGQMRRLRPLAVAALEHYGMHGADLRLLRHAENTTYRIDVEPGHLPPLPEGPYIPNRFLLRLHGPGYQTAATLHSESLWLQTLRQDAELPVPEPVVTREGQFCVAIRVPGVPSPRFCRLLRWMTGRHRYRNLSPPQVRQLGRLMARMHLHAQHWKPPAGFQRRCWDGEGLFRTTGGFGIPAKVAWQSIPEPYYRPLRQVADELAKTMQTLGNGSEVFGLIHADLGLSNVLFSGGEARAIDFDDCGFGYWIYDVAVTLRRWRWRPEWPVYRQAFVTGYHEVLPLPVGLWCYLNIFMAGRNVLIALWAAGKASSHTHLRRDLPARLKTAVDFIAQYKQIQSS